jgi:hypothetical protein
VGLEIVGTDAIDTNGAETAGAEPSYLPGLASNFAPHPLEQKYQVRPACASDAAAFSGNTFMPHTGSISATTTSST